MEFRGGRLLTSPLLLTEVTVPRLEVPASLAVIEIAFTLASCATRAPSAFYAVVAIDTPDTVPATILRHQKRTPGNITTIERLVLSVDKILIRGKIDSFCHF